MPVASPLTPCSSTEEGMNACLCLHPITEQARHGPGSATRVPHPWVLESRMLSVCPSRPQPFPLAHCVLEPDLCMDVPGFLPGPSNLGLGLPTGCDPLCTAPAPSLGLPALVKVNCSLDLCSPGLCLLPLPPASKSGSAPLQDISLRFLPEAPRSPTPRPHQHNPKVCLLSMDPAPHT